MISNKNRKKNFLMFIVIGKIAVLLLGIFVMIMLARNWTSYVFVVLSTILSISIYLSISKLNFNLLSIIFIILFIFEIYYYVLDNLILDKNYAYASIMANIMSLSIILAGMLISSQAILGFSLLNIGLIFVAFFGFAGDWETWSGFVFLSTAFAILIGIISWLYQRSLEKADAENQVLFERVEAHVEALAEKNQELDQKNQELDGKNQELDGKNQELDEKNQELGRLDELKDEFMANTSHELRTPLHGIIGLAESLIEGAAGELSERAKTSLAMIALSGKRLANLVNDILDFSKLKNNEIKLRCRPTDLHSLTEIVLTFSESLIVTKPLELHNEIDEQVPLVSADENRVQQILYNLVGNAIKFTESGRVTVSAQVEGEFLVITVTDTGIGIALEHQEHIFKSFEQVDGSIDRQYSGTGLGLSVTKQLVELHQGRIWVESEVNQGSSFSFSLPLAAEEEAAEVERGVNKKIALLKPYLDKKPVLMEQPTPFSLNGRRHILVVDDEPVNLQVLENHLVLENYTITKAVNGEQALELLKSGQAFDLILLDVMMPRMSGFEVCEVLREMYTTYQLPIIMLTAKDQAADVVMGFQVGANDYVTKPFGKDELLARIKTHLRLAKITSAYGRFVPHQILRLLSKESIIEIKLGDQIEQEMSLLFADIREFTSLSEQMSPKENFNFLNAYLSRVSPIIRRHDGFIDKYMGDGMMALFPQTANDAINAAIAMQKEVQLYNTHRQSVDYEPIRIGIGIHSGSVMLGTIGETERMEGTVIADAVNLTARLEELTKRYGASILISSDTFLALDDMENYHFRFLGKVKVKGKSKTVSIFEVLNGDTEELMALKIQTKAEFELGLILYHRHRLRDAKACFDRVLELNPKDQAAKLYSQRIKHLNQYGVPVDWEELEMLMEGQVADDSSLVVVGSRE